MRRWLLIPGEPCAEDRLQAIRAAGADAGISVELLQPATENALRQRLSEGGIDAVWLITRASVRATAGHATVDLRASDGQAARPVNVRHLGDLLMRAGGVRCVVLQAAAAPGSVEGLAPWFAAQGVPATMVLPTQPPLGWRVQASTMLRAMVEGRALAEVAAALGPGVSWAETPQPQATAGAADDGLPRATSPAPVGGSDRANGAAGPTMVASTAPGPSATSAEPLARSPADLLAEGLALKRTQGAFDVFLCHNGADKPAVRALARMLQARGLLPWLDEWELPPGKPWQPLLERQIERIGSAAVCVGAAGVGPWQEQELYGFLREFVSRGAAVIPVLLPDAPQAPELPVFLRAMTWVDFRVAEPDPMLRLHWGITGERPDFD